MLRLVRHANLSAASSATAAALGNRIPLQRLSTRLSGQSSDSDMIAARNWLSSFNPDSIPRSVGELSFSRSSGPGGQNVNKVNSKATLKVALEDLLPLLPSALHPQVRASRYCRSGTGVVLIQADESRKQAENTQKCFAKLHDMILEAAAQAIPGETSDAQRARVKGLQASANANRLKAKKLQSQKKKARKGGRGSDE